MNTNKKYLCEFRYTRRTQHVVTIQPLPLAKKDSDQFESHAMQKAC